MTVEQLLGGIMAFAIVLAAINVLMGGIGASARRALRLGPRQDGSVPSAREALRSAKRRRDDHGAPDALRKLNNLERARYVTRWSHLHRRASALPATTLLDADDLLTHMLRDIGYPTEGFVEHAAELSRVHAAVVDDYRVARNIVFDTRLGLADTAQIRHALLRYAMVFECLAETELSDWADEAVA